MTTTTNIITGTFETTIEQSNDGEAWQQPVRIEYRALGSLTAYDVYLTGDSALTFWMNGANARGWMNEAQDEQIQREIAEHAKAELSV